MPVDLQYSVSVVDVCSMWALEVKVAWGSRLEDKDKKEYRKTKAKKGKHPMAPLAGGRSEETTGYSQYGKKRLGTGLLRLWSWLPKSDPSLPKLCGCKVHDKRHGHSSVRSSPSLLTGNQFTVIYNSGEKQKGSFHHTVDPPAGHHTFVCRVGDRNHN